MANERSTIKDIARELGVSPSTVSRALKDNPDISQETRDAIHKYAREHNYKPNVLALNLRTSRSNTIGVIIPQLVHHFFSCVLSGIERTAAEAGYNILRAVGFPVAGPEVITCPTCGRTQYPCTEIANEVERRLQGCKKSIKVAVMGCVVNGPGEAREADIGIAGGKGEAVLFVHGEPVRKLTGENILDQFMEEIYKL